MPFSPVPSSSGSIAGSAKCPVISSSCHVRVDSGGGEGLVNGSIGVCEGRVVFEDVVFGEIVEIDCPGPIGILAACDDTKNGQENRERQRDVVDSLHGEDHL